MMLSLVFLDRDALRADVRRPSFAHVWREYGESAPEEVVERLRGAEIAIVNKVALRERELAELPRLKFIAVAATGVDIIDLESCRARGIQVANVRHYATHAVPEHALMLMLALSRNLVHYRAEVARGAWQEARQFCLFDQPIRDLHERRLGIIGYGALGQAVERLALAFGMRVLISEHKHAQEVRAGRVSFEEVLRECDIITLHCPLTPETRQLIGATELELMRKDALLINTARGGLVDEAALAEALLNRRIGGAGFDVLSEEPPRGGNPLLELRLPNFILTPHNAWASDEAMQALADQLIDNIEAFVRGEPRNLVT
ncbi:MAG: D-2-hydroxyacid dehydrogenase [Acidobacteria bacterium]|nr:D-2-hydroxyacid dehydrogenase [Acidobacteriota bacterium]